MLNNGVCDPACNNAECDYNDCSADQIMEKCLVDQDRAGASYNTLPSNEVNPSDPAVGELVPMNVQFDLAPARLEINTDINEMILTQEVGFQLQWQDTRLVDSPCKVVLTELLSLTREEANSDQQRSAKSKRTQKFWLPRIEAEDQTPGYYAWIEEGAYTYEDPVCWDFGLVPKASDAEAARRRLQDDIVHGAAARKALAHKMKSRRPGAIESDPVTHDDLRAARKSLRKMRMTKGGASKGRRRLRAFGREQRRRLSSSNSSDSSDSSGNSTDSTPEGGQTGADDEEEEEGEECDSVPGLATYAGEVEFELLQGFKYTKFPFDTHTITMHFAIEGAWIYTCKNLDAIAIMGVDDENAQEVLLPGTGTWLLDGTLHEAVSLRHSVDAETNEEDYSTCILEVKIKRNYMTYFVKQVVTLIMVTFAGLLGLLLQPGDLLGDRCLRPPPLARFTCFARGVARSCSLRVTGSQRCSCQC